MIQSVSNPAPPPPIRYANSGTADQTGVETQLNYRVMTSVDIQFSYSYLDPDQLTAFNPRHQIKYMVEFNSGKFRTSFFGKYIDHIYADNNSLSRLQDYHVLNLVSSYNFGQWEINLRLLNLLDRHYYVQPDYPAPGFYFLAGVGFEL
jgi:iron complex outermembrane receptor protein